MPSPATHYRRRTILSSQRTNQAMKFLRFIPSKKSNLNVNLLFYIIIASFELDSNAVENNEPLMMALTGKEFNQLSFLSYQKCKNINYRFNNL